MNIIECFLWSSIYLGTFSSNTFYFLIGVIDSWAFFPFQNSIFLLEFEFQLHPIFNFTLEKSFFFFFENFWNESISWSNLILQICKASIFCFKFYFGLPILEINYWLIQKLEKELFHLLKTFDLTVVLILERKFKGDDEKFK
jgi:hypothetical protein